MQVKTLTRLFAATTVTVAAIGLSGRPAEAQARRFSCGSSNGYPATVAQTNNGTNVPVIVWESSYFNASGYTPEVRCNLVSERFEQYFRQGLLDRLQGGYMNGQPVVCTQGSGGQCGNLLFTLKQGVNPNQALVELTNVRNRAASALYESTDGNSSYIDFNVLLQQLQDTEPADYAF